MLFTAAMQSIFSTIQRVEPAQQGKLMNLMRLFIQDPEDRHVMPRLVAILRDAPQAKH
jgi:hypothetical protein